MVRYFMKPKKIKQDNKEYLVFGVTEGATPMAVAQYKTRYGYKEVKNLSIRQRLAKNL